MWQKEFWLSNKTFETSAPNMIFTSVQILHKDTWKWADAYQSTPLRSQTFLVCAVTKSASCQILYLGSFYSTIGIEHFVENLPIIILRRNKKTPTKRGHAISNLVTYNLFAGFFIFASNKYSRFIICSHIMPCHIYS